MVFVSVKCPNMTCSLNSRIFLLVYRTLSSTGLSLFVDSECTCFHYNFFHRAWTKSYKGQLMTLKIPQCLAIQRDHPGLQPSNILDNVVLQYPRLFHRRHCLGQ